MEVPRCPFSPFRPVNAAPSRWSRRSVTSPCSSSATPGPFIGYTVMPLLLITVLRPLYASVGAEAAASRPAASTRPPPGMAVMFSLFALKVVGASLLNERTWHTWDRLQSSPARSATILAGKALPMYVVLLAQQAVLFGFAAVAFGFRPIEGWWPLAGCAAAWSACVLLLGTAASTLARSPAQLSAAGDLLAILTTILAGALVPSSLLPGWLRAIAPASPGYWAVHAYRAAITGQTGGAGATAVDDGPLRPHRRTHRGRAHPPTAGLTDDGVWPNTSSASSVLLSNKRSPRLINASG